MHTSCNPENITHADIHTLVWEIDNAGFSYNALYEGKCVGAVEHLSDNSWGASFDGKRLHHRDCQYTLGEAMECVENFWRQGKFSTR